MTKAVLAIAAALFAAMTVFASSAQACISCEHVPVVVRGSQTSHATTRYTKRRFYKVAKKHRARPAKKRIAKRTTTTKKVARLKTAPIKRDAKNENSTISTASLGKDETIDTEETPTEEPEANKNVGCKKFFPSVGMTLTVPCE
jgi:hypothetical protein